MRRATFHTDRSTESARTVDGARDLVTVTGVRPGLSSRRIVVLANRDALAAPGMAELSGTAAMLELARVFQVRELRKTLVLVSTSGGTGGGAGAPRMGAAQRRRADRRRDRARRRREPARAQAVRRPVVERREPAAARPRRARSRRRSAARSAATPADAHATGQWARRALPFTVSAQGEPAAEGVPAVLLSASGERGPAPNATVTEARMAELGRAAVRAITAIDAAGAGAGTTAGAAFVDEPEGIVTVRNVLPDWSMRLLVGCLLLPALLAALDGYFRARRRRLPVERWLLWVGALAAPFLVAWAWARGLGVAGAVNAPGAPVLAGWVPAGDWRPRVWAGLGRARVGARRGCSCARGWPRRAGVRGSPAAGGAGAAIGAVLVLLTARGLAGEPLRRRRCSCRPRTRGCSSPRPARACAAGSPAPRCSSAPCPRCCSASTTRGRSARIRWSSCGRGSSRSPAGTSPSGRGVVALALGGLLRGPALHPARAPARRGALAAGTHPYAWAGHLRRSRLPRWHRVGAATLDPCAHSCGPLAACWSWPAPC